MPLSGRIQRSFGPLRSLPSKSFTRTVIFLSGVISHNSFFPSAQATRFPSLSKYVPLERPDGFSQSVAARSSAFHFTMRWLGWSVKKTLPSLSAAGPSVNSHPPASFSSVAPGAMIFESAAGREPAIRSRLRAIRMATVGTGARMTDLIQSQSGCHARTDATKTSNIEHRTLYIEHRTSNVEHPMQCRVGGGWIPLPQDGGMGRDLPEV